MIKYSPAPFHRRRLIVELARRVPFRSLLDVGCGQGECLRLMQREFNLERLLGIDLSPAVIDMNRREMPGAEFLALDISQQPVPGTWELVVCSEVLEHIDDYMTALRNLRHACSRHLIVTVPSGRVFPIDREMGHYRHFSPQMMVDALRQSGFEPRVVWRWGFPFHTAYKYLINLSPDASLKRFGGGSYSWTEKAVGRVLTALFYANTKRVGAQLVVLADATHQA
jgi:SAM-dependent methyltransferase